MKQPHSGRGKPPSCLADPTAAAHLGPTAPQGGNLPRAGPSPQSAEQSAHVWACARAHQWTGGQGSWAKGEDGGWGVPLLGHLALPGPTPVVLLCQSDPEAPRNLHRRREGEGGREGHGTERAAQPATGSGRPRVTKAGLPVMISCGQCSSPAGPRPLPKRGWETAQAPHCRDCWAWVGLCCSMRRWLLLGTPKACRRRLCLAARAGKAAGAASLWTSAGQRSLELLQVSPSPPSAQLAPLPSPLWTFPNH